MEGKGRGDGTPNRPRGKADRDNDRSRTKTPDRRPRGRKDRSKSKPRKRSRTPRRPDQKEPKFKEVKAKYGSSRIWVGTTKRSGGKNLEICKDYNLKGKCPRGSACKTENRCDVIPKGKKSVCGSKSHTRQEHREGVWYA